MAACTNLLSDPNAIRSIARRGPKSCAPFEEADEEKNKSFHFSFFFVLFFFLKKTIPGAPSEIRETLS